MFKIGDKIRLNRKFDNNFPHEVWWNEWKDKELTVTRIAGEFRVEVEENPYIYSFDWIIKVRREDFIKEDEFSL
jgi:hypothetical protein